VVGKQETNVKVAIGVRRREEENISLQEGKLWE